MKKHIIIFLISLLVCCSWSNTEEKENIPEGIEISSQEYANTIQFTKKRIRHLMRKKHLPAFAITIVNNKGIIYQQAFGMADMENNTEASANTVFKLYSVSKLFTALEIFREVEEGLVDPDNSIMDYLPDFIIQSRNNDYRNITVKSILAHRSGLPRNECVLVSDAEHDINALKKFELATAGCYMAFPVGYRYKYSNLGYNLLGRIIEENRHKGFSGFMREHLLYDLNMKNSSFNSADLSDKKLIAKGYEYYKHKFYPMIQSDITNVPSGNLYSTIEDLSVFLKAMINNKIFKNQETMSQMFVDHYSKRIDPETMGLGLKTTKLNGSELMVWHDGGPTDGVGTLVAVLPYRNLGIALVSNSTSFEGNISVPLAAEIFKKLLETKSEKDHRQSEKQERAVSNRQLLSVYEGKYPAFGQVMNVKARGDKLKAKIGGFGLDLIPVDDTEFRVTHWIDRIGLTKILDLPIDFDKIKIEFQKYNSPDSCNMIINLDNITFEICQRYPDHFEIPGNWDDITGEYRMAERLPDDKAGNFTGSRWTIFMEDNVLMMSGVFGPIVPLDEKSLIITSGPFAGETIEYKSESGNLVHQNAVFVPFK